MNVIPVIVAVVLILGFTVQMACIMADRAQRVREGK